MEIAIVDRDNRYCKDLISNIQKKFNGVHFTVFRDLEELIEKKTIFDIACFDQITCKEYSSNKMYKKHVKDVLCVCYKEDDYNAQRNEDFPCIKEEELEKEIVHKIREFIKQEKCIEINEENRKKHLFNYILVYLVIMMIATSIDRTSNFSNLFLALFVFGTCLMNSFYWLKKENKEFSKKKFVISMLMNILILALIFGKEIVSVLQNL